MKKEIFTTSDELIKMITSGHFFTFCVAFALNKGFKDAIKEKIVCEFSVGDYNVKFEPKEMCFYLTHKKYFARIIQAYYSGVHFVGDNEDEVIDELLTNYKKEIFYDII